MSDLTQRLRDLLAEAGVTLTDAQFDRLLTFVRREIVDHAASAVEESMTSVMMYAVDYDVIDVLANRDAPDGGLDVTYVNEGDAPSEDAPRPVKDAPQA